MTFFAGFRRKEINAAVYKDLKSLKALVAGSTIEAVLLYCLPVEAGLHGS